jgi:DNA-binding beta-propeller fold protein YncE
MTAFSFPAVGATGAINESNHTIAVTVPYGTNVTNLVATFSTTGQSVKIGSNVQKSGETANNFSSPVTYTVVAADSSTQNYVVTVTLEPAPQMVVQIEGPTTIPSGTGSVTIGPIYSRQTHTETFWIYNQGPAGSFLRLTGSPSVQVSGADAAGFTMGQYPSTPIASGNNVTFTIDFTPRYGLRLYNASISISSNDPTKNPYTFALKGNTFYRTYDTHGTRGTGPGQFNTPVAVAYNPVNSCVYVADRVRDKVLIFNSAGTFVKEFGPASGNGCLAGPESLAIDSDGYVYVASYDRQLDAGFHYVQKFDKDGNWQTGWGSNGSGNGQFDCATGITISPAPANEVYVSDRFNNRVQVFSNTGTYSRQWTVSEPFGVWVFPGGAVLVWTNSSIEKFDSVGTWQGTFGGCYGTHIAGGGSDEVLASDLNGSIRVYSYLGVLKGDISCAGQLLNSIEGMAYGNGYLYFVNCDWGNPDFNGDNLLVRVQRFTPVP